MKDSENDKSGINNFAKYSAVSLQMLVTIGLFAFAGYKADQYTGQDNHLFTALLSLAGVIVSLYQIVKQLNKNQK